MKKKKLKQVNVNVRNEVYVRVCRTVIRRSRRDLTVCVCFTPVFYLYTLKVTPKDVDRYNHVKGYFLLRKGRSERMFNKEAGLKPRIQRNIYPGSLKSIDKKVCEALLRFTLKCTN